MAIKSWMLSYFSFENTATFAVNTCVSCKRFWEEALRHEAKPICKLTQWEWTRIWARYNEGNPYEYNLPEYVPLQCGRFLEK